MTTNRKISELPDGSTIDVGSFVAAVEGGSTIRATVPAASADNAGLMTSDDKTKLDGIEANATAATATEIADGSIGLEKLADGTPGRAVGFDSRGRAAEISLPQGALTQDEQSQLRSLWQAAPKGDTHILHAQFNAGFNDNNSATYQTTKGYIGATFGDDNIEEIHAIGSVVDNPAFVVSDITDDESFTGNRTTNALFYNPQHGRIVYSWRGQDESDIHPTMFDNVRLQIVSGGNITFDQPFTSGRVGGNGSEFESIHWFGVPSDPFPDGLGFDLYIYRADGQVVPSHLQNGAIRPFRTSAATTLAGVNSVQGLTEAEIVELIRRVVMTSSINTGWRS